MINSWSWPFCDHPFAASSAHLIQEGSYKKWNTLNIEVQYFVAGQCLPGYKIKWSDLLSAPISKVIKTRQLGLSPPCGSCWLWLDHGDIVVWSLFLYSYTYCPEGGKQDTCIAYVHATEFQHPYFRLPSVSTIGHASHKMYLQCMNFGDMTLQEKLSNLHRVLYWRIHYIQ